MKLQKLYHSPPKKRHLLWALPLGVLICAAMWWFEAFYSGSIHNYIISALIGSIPILAANWSRTLWPRLAVSVALVAVQLIAGSVFILAPQAA